MFKDRKAWAPYFGACLLAWLLYVLAGAEFQRGLWQLWEAIYQASLSLWAPMLLGAFVYPWVRALQRRGLATGAALALHALAALVFGALWQAGDYLVSWWLYGHAHAYATL